ncbi:hypothetical protein HaLaN_28967 [Haematococcus lacustris]|uniref:Uncharacterized protein n=1 Tax=Haematococcus lacustris TaxID=44745 RepID=A0A6A0ABD7_HAELA|nr:hypothetical protein HaLaN_28967 [Haematococcus lacustris]
MPGVGANTRPSAAIAAVLAAHPNLCARLEAIPRYHSDTNMVDHVGKQLGKRQHSATCSRSSSLAGSRSHWACWGLRRGSGWMMTGWRRQQTRAGCCAMRCTPQERWRQPWQPGSWIWCPGSSLSPPSSPTPTPYAITPTSKCQARHVFIDTKGLYGMMRDAGMLGVLTERGVTSLTKIRDGALPDPAEPGKFIAGPKDSQVDNRWDALLPDPRRQYLASPKHNFAQIVHTDGFVLSVMILWPKPAAPPAKLPGWAGTWAQSTRWPTLTRSGWAFTRARQTWPLWCTRSATLSAQ